MIQKRLVAAIFSVLGLVACSEPGQSNLSNEPSSQGSASELDIASAKMSATMQDTKGSDITYTTIEWTDLIPEEDLEALLNPPEYLEEIEDGSEADVIDSQIQSTSPTASDDRYQQALVSKTIIPEFDHRAIRIPGFIVPLEFNDFEIITTFFLVPFFGACIHMPPPPPNQIIYAEYEPGIKLEFLYDPYWIEGTLTTTLTENATATAAYAMTVDSIEEYSDEP